MSGRHASGRLSIGDSTKVNPRLPEISSSKIRTGPELALLFLFRVPGAFRGLVARRRALLLANGRQRRPRASVSWSASSRTRPMIAAS